jgi:hypothetical protein
MIISLIKAPNQAIKIDNHNILSCDTISKIAVAVEDVNQYE